MPEVGGTDAEQAAIWQILNRYKHVFGPPPVGGSKLRPMSIELKPGFRFPNQHRRRASPDIWADIRADTELRTPIKNGWMRKTMVGDKCRFASPVVAVRQPGKTTRRVCSEYRAINDICFATDAREVLLILKVLSTLARLTCTRVTSSCDWMRKLRSYWLFEHRMHYIIR